MPLDRPLVAALLAALLPSGLFGFGVATAPPPAPELPGAPVEDRWIELFLKNAPPLRPPDLTHTPELRHLRRIVCAYPHDGTPHEPVAAAPPTFTSGGIGGGIAIGPIDWSTTDRVLTEAAPRLLRCISAIPSSLRSFNLRLNVSDQGVVELARIEGETGITDDMRDCMVGVLQRLRFAAHPGRGVTLVRYPLDPDLLDDGIRDRSFPGTDPRP